MMQQRRDEILAKKAKLAELKRQRELRARDVSASRMSVGSSSDVKIPPESGRGILTELRSSLPHLDEQSEKM
jgi:dynein intermediate chain, cytosolic